MPQITINDKTVEVEEGKRLVLVIEESGVAIGHRCGGQAKCTTCRVEFLAGEPESMTVAEFERLKQRELLGQYRLSCQIVCDHDMHVKPVMTVENQPQWNGDNGPSPQPHIEPSPDWRKKDDLLSTDQ